MVPRPIATPVAPILPVTDGFNRQLAGLRATGPDRLDGGAATLWR
jgi:hypothetical protein